MKDLALVGLALAWAAAGSAAAPSAPSLYAAHRGGALLWPENSLLAFRNAAELGADYLELDVHLSKDAEVVVIHDPTLGRTTTGTGAVRDRTLADLQGLRLKDRHGAVTGESIPTLDEVVAVAARSGRRLLLEIKVGPGRVRYSGIEEKVAAVLDRHRMTAATVIMAFEAETWRRVRVLRPDIAAGALYSARALEPGPGVARAIEAARAEGVGFVGLQHPLITAEVVARARAAGVLLGAWTVNEPDAMRRLIGLAVGVVVTDRPDVAKELVTKRRNP